MQGDDTDDTVIRRRRVPLSGDRAESALADTVIRPVPSSLQEDDQPGEVGAPGDRGASTAEDTVIRPAPPAVPAGPSDDALGDTVVRVPTRPTVGGSPSAGAEPRLPSGPPAPAVPAAPTTRVPSVRVGDRVHRLDRPVIIGRRPSLPRISRGPTPELVTVPSRSGQVSSSHVLVHAEGEAVVVDDLRSTNGTVVRPPGAPPFRMPSGASNVVLTGTVVEIGDGNVIEVLSPHLRVAPRPGDFPPPPTRPSDPQAGTPQPPRERS